MMQRIKIKVGEVLAWLVGHETYLAGWSKGYAAGHAEGRRSVLDERYPRIYQTIDIPPAKIHRVGPVTDTVGIKRTSG